MIKIKVCDMAPRGACSYYRGLGVLNKLRKINPDISVEYLEAVSWTALSDCDILFLMRPIEPSYIEAIELAKSFGVKTWVDFDDLLHEIPADNPGFEYFSEPRLLKNIEYALVTADAVTFSTEEIKKYYDKIRPDSIIIPNAFNDYNYSIIDKPNIDSKAITWRGSNTHRNDLLSQREEMIKVARTNPSWQWGFIGGDPLWYVTDYVPNSTGIKEMDIVRYHRFMLNIKPAIHIVPLIDSIFNRAKSNISWMEGTAAGATCLCPSLPEFTVPGAVNYTDNFAYLMEKMIKSKGFRRENWETSREYITKKLLLSKVNKLRLRIIEELIK